MNYYEIATLTYIGKETNLLTYSSLEDLKAGHVVKISIRNKATLGVVINKVEKPSFITKEIIEIVLDKPVLTKELLKLTDWISGYYVASKVSVLQSVVPSGISKKRRKLETKELNTTLEKPLKLTTDQASVFENISNSLTIKPHLLFGVTGSGKTEIYLQLIDKVRREGKQAILLVPEISLTPQTIARFEKRFGNDVVLLHSYLKETERFANWKAVLDGEKNIIVGSRSAIFAPCQNLGLIIIDEEHETSYKQDKTPRYDAIKVAKKLAEFSGAGLVLGSATPRIETFYRANNSEYYLHTLSNRIVQTNLPKVDIVDMRHEFKYGNYSIFSEKLQQEIIKTIKAKRQVILFLNRRGMSTFVSCRECGHVETCPNCETSLTFHFNEMNLRCHYCNHQKPAPISCPECKSPAIKYFGTGTQRIEEEIKKLFGKKYRVVRMDTDTTKTTGSHENIFRDFSDNKYDILIGTQMITKGWDLPNIGLVGVISADTAINFPDFSASERTFDLLTQVAGRTGRGKEDEGKVIIQTYSPEHYSIRYAAKHDYLGFYNEEIQNREELGYPPFAKLVKLLYNNSDEELGTKTSMEFKNGIHEALKDYEFKILGPSPAFIPKMNNKYYFQITLKLFNTDEQDILNIGNILSKLSNNEWSIDIDPTDLL